MNKTKSLSTKTEDNIVGIILICIGVVTVATETKMYMLPLALGVLILKVALDFLVESRRKEKRYIESLKVSLIVLLLILIFYLLSIYTPFF
ncbi:hypothetical protein [Pontibacillus yanchengensis]|uniref:Uncharacterized protein n=1 Tax=Pontibacillus yanchengensis Y32 TaxID=1385514 RepID=A0A0A2TFC0_9BACI|nr:hypothetical protein [Pontibacillus yanchengensis]KGP74254.1 hypothetical protein N782_09275 [Pontibacillus yanchengensis Y32]